MAIGACAKDNLLTVFADNTTQNISPADMRLLITCIYDNFLEVLNVIDDLDTYETQKALSANAGALLNDKLENNTNDITDLQNNKADVNLVYTKAESDTRYFTQDQINSGFYNKTEVYNKQEIDNMIFSLQQSIIDLNDRIDNIVAKNNLQE